MTDYTESKNLLYNKRHGIINKGKDYEIATATLLALRLCFDQRVVDFRMAFDPENYGAFDDIIVDVQYKSPDSLKFKQYVVQLKHKDKSELSKSDLTDGKPKFSLKKYRDSYHQNRANFGLQRGDTNRQSSEEDITVCLYTNAKLREYDNISLKSSFLSCDGTPQKSDEFDFINAQDNFYTFDVTRNDKRDDFQFKLGEHFQHLPGNSDALKAPDKCKATPNFSDYVNFVRDVVSKEGPKIFDGLNESLVQKITQCFQSGRVYEEYTTEINKEIKKRTRNQNHYEVFDSFFQDYFGHRFRLHQMDKYVQFFRAFRFYDGQLNLEQTKEKIFIITECTFGEVPPNYMKSLTKYVKHHFEAVVGELLTKSKLKEKLCELFLGGGKPSESKYEKFSGTLYLSPSERYIELLKTIQISFNNKNPMDLHDLTDKTFSTTLAPPRLIRHCKRNIVLGEELKPDFNNYIERKFYKPLLRKEVLWKTRNNVFILNTGVDVEDRVKMHFLCPLGTKTMHFIKRSVGVGEGSKQTPSRNFDSRKNEKVHSSMNHSTEQNLELDVNGENIVLVLMNHNLEECAQSLLERENLNHYAKHYLEMGGNHLEWRRSWGDVTDFNDFLVESETVHEKDLLQHFTNAINVISAIPGMGKSTVLTSLMAHCPRDKLALRLNLNEYSKKKIVRLLKDPWDYVSLNDPGDSLKKDLFEQFKKSGRVLLFMDGCDEIVPEYIDELMDCIEKLKAEQISVWLAMQPITRRYIKKLNILTVNMKRFSKEEATRYLNYDESLIAKIPAAFIDVPLHINMFCNIWKSNEVESSEIDLPALFEKFIDLKLDIYCEKKYGEIINKSQADMVAIKKEALRQHRLIALCLTYGKEFVVNQKISSEREIQQLMENLSENKMGLIVSMREGRPIFWHHTIAEFLADSWLAENPSHSDFLISKAISTAEMNAEDAVRKRNSLYEKSTNTFNNNECKSESVLTESMINYKFIRQDIDETRSSEWNMEVPKAEEVKRNCETEATLRTTTDQRKLTKGPTDASKTDELQSRTALKGSQGSSRNSHNNESQQGRSASSSIRSIDLPQDCHDMFYAAKKGHVDKIQSLLQKNVDVNAADKDGWTALHFASAGGHLECVKFLHNAGANINAKTENQESAHQIASRNQRDEVASWLNSIEIDQIGKFSAVFKPS